MTDEMFHAATRIMANRAEQLGVSEDELMHAFQNRKNENKYITRDEIDKMVDEEIENIPFEQIKLMGENYGQGRIIAPMSQDQKDALFRLRDAYTRKITKKIDDYLDHNDLQTDPIRDGTVRQMVYARLTKQIESLSR